MGWFPRKVYEKYLIVMISRLLDTTISTISEALELLPNKESKTFATSSFQTQSIPLLHIISKYFPQIPIIFIDTGFLFPETYDFALHVKKQFNLDIIRLESKWHYKNQLVDDGRFLFSIDQDKCCKINKTDPVNDFLNKGDVWINGIRKDQTTVRAEKVSFEKLSTGVLKVHPMLEWKNKDVYNYINSYDLPKHPIEQSGYLSIGCTPCTKKWITGDIRSGRWAGGGKIECGLHLEE